MVSFFHGWRRKAGCVTLVMACVVTTLWVRSQARPEDAFLPFGSQTTLQFLSQESVLTVRTFVSPFRVGTADVGPDRLLLFGVFPPRGPSTGNVAFSADEINRRQLGTPYAWTFQRGGFGLARFQDDELSLRVVIVTIPYWSIAIPLTLLSAYLILWKPRNRAANQ